MNYDIVILGHFSNDKLVIRGVEKKAAGGAVYYGGLALGRMNIRSAIITLLKNDDFHQLDILKRNGVDVFAHESQVTSGIRNRYVTDDHDKRICEPLTLAGAFKEEHVTNIESKVLHIGSLMAGEVSLGLVQYITKRFPKVSLDLQGFLRVRQGKELKFVDWPEKEQGLGRIHTVKADSVEAEVITGEKNLANAARMIASWGPKEVIITHSEGLLVYAGGEVFEASFVIRSLDGRTGRGDTCIVAYLARRLTSSAEDSCKFAAAVTSLKLEKEGPLDKTFEDILDKIDRDY